MASANFSRSHFAQLLHKHVRFVVVHDGMAYQINLKGFDKTGATRHFEQSRTVTAVPGPTVSKRWCVRVIQTQRVIDRLDRVELEPKNFSVVMTVKSVVPVPAVFARVS
jgi:hypothetical protein